MLFYFVTREFGIGYRVSLDWLEEMQGELCSWK